MIGKAASAVPGMTANIGLFAGEGIGVSERTNIDSRSRLTTQGGDGFERR
jgi:hypothetical protein